MEAKIEITSYDVDHFFLCLTSTIMYPFYINKFTVGFKIKADLPFISLFIHQFFSRTFYFLSYRNFHSSAQTSITVHMYHRCVMFLVGFN